MPRLYYLKNNNPIAHRFLTMRYVFRTLLCFLLLLSTLATAQEETNALDAISFLEGSWQTKSLFTRDDSTAPGVLTYQRVLGGAWLKVTFIGDHPSGRVWEAHGMIGPNPAGDGYISHIFFGPGEPAVYSGLMLEDNVFRLETTFNGRTSGIDYRPQPDGTVYQENWVLTDDNQRYITLKTWYTPQ